MRPNEQKKAIEIIRGLEKEVLVTLAAKAEGLQIEDFAADTETTLRDRVLRHVMAGRLELAEEK